MAIASFGFFLRFNSRSRARARAIVSSSSTATVSRFSPNRCVVWVPRSDTR
jgi:hypothetical protein